MRLYNPWPEPYTINPGSRFGMRRHPKTGQIKMHHGVDVALPIGTPLIAGADGTIAHKGSGASGGYTLLIRHAGNFHTVYYHLNEPSHLNIGEPVRAGDRVAFSGNTGASTGPHLHFEVRPRSRQWGQTDDPEKFLIGPFRPGNLEPAPVERPERPSMLNRVSPGLESMSRAWIARGKHFLRRGR
jgi:murein DD-endopeptidase MepM/ murein hydrolase activator NlpD